jgi:hypothetical protein
VTAWPALSQDRLADAVTVLARRVAEPDVRAQLHALAGILRNLGAQDADEQERRRLEESLVGALGDGTEPGVIAQALALARLDRSAVRPVDWSAASGG